MLGKSYFQKEKRASKYIESFSDEDDVNIPFDDDQSDSNVFNEIIDTDISDYVGVR